VGGQRLDAILVPTIGDQNAQSAFREDEADQERRYGEDYSL
jgi:hypothetical protein